MCRRSRQMHLKTRRKNDSKVGRGDSDYSRHEMNSKWIKSQEVVFSVCIQKQKLDPLTSRSLKSATFKYQFSFNIWCAMSEETRPSTLPSLPFSPPKVFILIQILIWYLTSPSDSFISSIHAYTCGINGMHRVIWVINPHTQREKSRHKSVYSFFISRIDLNGSVHCNCVLCYAMLMWTVMSGEWVNKITR